MTTTATATPAERLAADYKVQPEDLSVSLADSKTAMLSWAGRDGRFNLEDLEDILRGHGETLSAWVDDCDAHGFQSVYNAEAVLAWLGY
jgi:hypothetical protein